MEKIKFNLFDTVSVLINNIEYKGILLRPILKSEILIKSIIWFNIPGNTQWICMKIQNSDTEIKIKFSKIVLIEKNTFANAMSNFNSLRYSNDCIYHTKEIIEFVTEKLEWIQETK